MLTVGKIVIAAKGSDEYGQVWTRETIIVDAEPYVMMLARKLFDKGRGSFAAGKYTHRILDFPLNQSSAKDVLMLMFRFNFEISADDKNKIDEYATKYDSLMSRVASFQDDKEARYSAVAAIPQVSPREHQIIFKNLADSVKRTLLADMMGMGKTISALITLSEPDSRPALIVCPPTLCTQWRKEVNRVFPEFSTHVISGFKNYDLPDVDVLITSYNRLGPWEDRLVKHWPTMILDEVHELRKTDTQKRKTAKSISMRCDRVFGLSGTPIFNYGVEIWSVLDAIKPDCLGEERDFSSEWCSWDRTVSEPAVLHNYLKNQGLMLRRTPEEAGLKFGEGQKHFYTIDSDLKSLEAIQDVMKTLALSLLSMKVGKVDEDDVESHEAARNFDYKLRLATGVAKAKSVAQFVRMMIDQGEKVVLAGWHRDVYDIWNRELSDLNPVMFTGSESPKEKSESVKKFVEDDSCKVFIISLRSGAGLDGLQYVCRNVVFGELDWSPHVMDQVFMRVDRDGQRLQAQGYYLAINDGSDPFIMNILSNKRSQHDGLVEGKQSEGEVIAGMRVDPARVQEMAKEYLKSLGEEIPEPVTESGALKEVSDAVRSIKLPTNTEDEMQQALEKLLPGLVPGLKVEREVKIGKRSRLDFLVSSETERVAIELKNEQHGRSAVYKQIRKYIEEGNVTSVVLLAPWFGIPSFVIDGIPVVVVDYTKNSI